MLTFLKRSGGDCLPGWSVFMIMACSHLAVAQQPLPDTLLTIEVNRQPISELLKIISRESGIPFSYNPQKIHADQIVSYQARSKTLASILADLYEQFNLQASIVEQQIILKPGRKGSATRTVILSGYVKDKRTGEALIGANLLIKELKSGIAANAFGFYSLTVPPGSYTLICTFLGFKTDSAVVDLRLPLRHDIFLEEEPPLLQEIVVSAAEQPVINETETGKVSLRKRSVEERPALFGEMDVVKSLESVPGVKLHSDGSTFYYVRGGNRDQNLILIDDAPIYNPSHLLGLFSTIIPDAVNDLTLYKGSMPASLGGRLSSILDVRTKKGNDQYFQGWGNVGLISTKVGIEGPFKKDWSSFLVTARVSRLKWFFHSLDKNIDRFNFYDVTGKMNFKLNAGNRIFFSLYSGADNYFANNSGIAWTNTAGTVKWNHLFSDRLFLNTTLAGSSYDYNLFTEVDSDTKWNSHISNANLKADFTYFINPENEFTFGLGLNGYYFNPGNLTSGKPITNVPVLSVKNSTEFVIYGNDDVKLGPHWGVNYGVRLSTWTNSGKAYEFVFDQNKNPIDTLHYNKGENYKSFFNVEPRLTVSYRLNEKSSFKTSLSRNVQNVHLITNSISPFTSMEVWLPSSLNIQPEAAHQLVVGYYHSFSDAGIVLSVESFYKKMFNQIDYVDHASTLLNPLVESQLRFGSATSYGIEFLARKDAGRWRGLAGYTYARAKRQFADLNQGKPFNAFYDRPNQIDLMIQYDLTLRWNFGLNWNYSTGSPYPSPVSYYSFNGLEVPVYGQKNNVRLPDYHRMDISATHRLNKNPEKKFQHSLTFSIFNLYGRKNPLFINYNKKELNDGSFKIPSNLVDVTRTSSQFYLFKFTPSISYNFKF